ncbi:MAG: hypothetical protein JWO67_3208 [Streptosporangiaceae bacterium]|nr:hypothetical protein [Streptosporangiaceae bacterium]
MSSLGPEFPTPPLPAHPPQGVPVAREPDDLPNLPLRAHDVSALLDKKIG